jgi:hypothetical protein
MKILLSELMLNTRFRYLFGNFALDLNETELSLLGFPSSKTYEQAILDFSQDGYTREIKMTYQRDHNHK